MGIPTDRRCAREAVGVVGAITPWNFPHQINLAKIGPALAAGNTVVLKPAPDTPWCAAVLGRHHRRAHRHPAGVFNIVTSSDHTVGALLSNDPRVDMVSFTGSTNTGRAVMADAAADPQEGLPRTRRQVGVPRARRCRSRRRARDVGVHRVHACRPGLCDHHPPGGAAGRATTRRSRPRPATMGALGPATRPTREPSAGRSSRRASATRPGLPGARRSRRAARSPAAGGGPPIATTASSSSRPSSRARQQRQGRPRGDLRAGARRDRPRRRRRRGAHRQRLALRAVGYGARADPRPRAGRGRADARRHRQRQRRRLVLGRRAVRRLQAVRHRPRDGPRRIRGVPRDQSSIASGA